MSFAMFKPRSMQSIRKQFCDLYVRRENDDSMLEIIGCQFEATDPAVFGKPDEGWHRRELDWYLKQSRNVNDIEPPVPSIWQQISARDGTINSNYGWCIYSEENGSQFANAIQAIVGRFDTRQATMIYTRPSMHKEAVENGRYDFVCTNTVQLLLRGGKLFYMVNMRSSDAVLGYKGDFAWHSWVQDQAVQALRARGVSKCDPGPIIWHADSFHIYPRHYKLVANWDIENWESI